MALLELEQLTIRYHTPAGVLTAVEEVSLQVEAGTCTVIVGESGSGKSQLLMACAGLLPQRAQSTGHVRLEGEDLLGAPLRHCGRGIGVVFQDAAGSLTPHRRIGAQLMEVGQSALALGAEPARRVALEMLERVGLPDPALQFGQYPHELSGGMRQRAAIAAALMSRPKLLLADEPTSALDVTVQAQLVALLMKLQRELGMALVLVTHDFSVATAMADRIAVMYAARVVEEGDARELLATPRHPYTAGLLAAVPRLDVVQARMQVIPGAPPAALARPAGCHFAPRCSQQAQRCREQVPLLQRAELGRAVACHFPLGEGGA